MLRRSLLRSQSRLLYIAVFIFLNILGAHADNLVVYDDALNPEFSNNGWTSATDLENYGPVYSGRYSIKFNTQNFQLLHYSSPQGIDRSMYDGVSFYVYPEGENVSPAISLQLTTEEGDVGPIMKLVSMSSPAQSAARTAQLIPGEWTKAFLPFPNDGVSYNGFKIISDTSQGGEIYIDQIEFEAVAPGIAGVTHRSKFSQSYPEPLARRSIDQSNPLVPGTVFGVSSAIADPSLGGDAGGHSFWVSTQLPFLNNVRTWSFFPGSGSLTVLPNGNLHLVGSIHPISEGPTSCNLWSVDITFAPSGPPEMSKDELAPEAYVEKGGPINPSTWRYFEPIPTLSHWFGYNCNKDRVITFTGVQWMMPLQIGAGANGKNGNLGLSVWLTFRDQNGNTGGDDNPIDINIDLIPPASSGSVTTTTPSTTGGLCDPSSITCSAGFVCQVMNGRPVCVQTTAPITTTGATQPPITTGTSGGNCDNTVTCATGWHCQVINGRPTCIPPATTTGISTGGLCDPAAFSCSAGFVCQVVNGRPVCVQTTAPITTTGATQPPITTTGTSGGNCDNTVTCATGWHCQVVNGRPTCIPPATTTGISTGGLCDPASFSCSAGFVCQVINGRPTCIQTTAPITTGAPTTGRPPISSGGSPPPESCDNTVTCAVGWHCLVLNGKPTCVATSSGSPSSGTPATGGPQCDANVQCPPGFHCQIVNGGPACVPTTPATTGRPPFTSGGPPPESCDSTVTCAVGWHCLVLNGKPTCVSTTSPATTGTPTTNPPGLCDPSVTCAVGHHCILVNGHPACIPTTSSPSSGGSPPPQSCDSTVTCAVGWHCLVLNGKPTCVSTTSPVTTGTPTTNPPGLCDPSVTCAVGHHCVLINGRPTCIATSGGSTVGNPCNGVNCPTGYYCQAQNGQPTCIAAGTTTSVVTTTGGSTGCPFYNTIIELEGFTYIDLDNNGLYEPSKGDALGPDGIIATLFHETGARAIGISGSTIHASRTDIRGHFSFANIAPGRYYIQFTNVPPKFKWSPQIGSNDESESWSDANGKTHIFNLEGPHGSKAVVRVVDCNIIVTADPISSGINPGQPDLTFGVGHVVFEDVDKDGIYTPGIDFPIANATVTLYKVNPDGSLVPATDLPVKTNEKGEYFFDELPPGEYVFEVTNTPTLLVHGTNSPYPVNPSTSRTPPILLGSNMPGIEATNGRFPINSLLINPNFNFPLVPINPTTGTPSPTPSPTPSTTGPSPTIFMAFGDTVWFDSNENGIQEAYEIVIDGVRLSLLDSNGNAVPGFQSVVTDISGRYFFDKVPADKYYIVAVTELRSGLKMEEVPLTDPAKMRTKPFLLSSTGPKTVPSAGFPVTSELIDPTIDIPVILATSVNVALAIGDTVFEDLNGDGIYDPGFDNPTPGVLMTLVNSDGSAVNNIHKQAVLPVRTDTRGQYYFDELLSRNYIVKISGWPQLLHLNPAPYVDVEGSQSKVLRMGPTAVDVIVNNNPTTYPVKATFINPKVDFPLGRTFIEVPTFSIGDTVFNDTNKDKTQNPNEKGIPNVIVSIKYANGTDVRDTHNVPIPPTKTDENGKYYFNDLPPGQYVVTISGIPPNHRIEAGTPGILANGSTVPFELSTTTPGVRPNDGKIPGLTGKYINPDIDFPIVSVPVVVPSKTTYAVGDTVFYDANKNGFQDPGELGIPNVPVILYRENGTVAVDNNGKPQTTTTDANGKYFFDLIPPGEYIIRYNYNDAFISTLVPELIDKATGILPINENDLFMVPVDRTVFPNIQADNINPHYDLPLYRDSYAFGHKTWLDANRNGRMDPTELPLPNVTVLIWNIKSGATDIFGRPILLQTTNDKGEYFYDYLPKEIYFAAFTAPSTIYTITKQTQYGIDASLPDPVSRITPQIDIAALASPNDGSNPNIKAPFYYKEVNAGYLLPFTYAVGDQIWFDNNKDGLTSPNEPGVPGVTATLYTSNHQPAMDVYGAPVLPRVTDINGRYLFTGIPGGLYHIGFTGLPNGYIWTPAFVSGGTEFDSRVYPVSGLTNNFFLDPSNQEVRFASPLDGVKDTFIDTYEDGGIIQGVADNVLYAIGRYAWIDSNRNFARDPTERPAPKVTATLLDSTGNPASDAKGQIIQPQLTDDNGYYLFDGVNAGAYMVQFSTIPRGYVIEDGTAPNYLTGRTPIFTLGPSLPDVDAQDPPGIVAKKIDRTENVGLIPGIPLGFGDFVFFSAPNGAPVGVQGATVTFTNSFGQPLLDIDGNAVPPAKTDINGLYRIDNLFQGSYIAKFSNFPPGFGCKDPINCQRAFNLYPESTNIRPTIPSDQAPRAIFFDPTVDQELTPPETFAIGDKVWYDRNGNGLQDPNEPPMVGVEVQLFSASQGPTFDKGGQIVRPVFTNANGEYFFDYLPAGVYSVRFISPEKMEFTAQLVNTPSEFNSAPGPLGWASAIPIGPGAIDMFAVPQGSSMRAEAWNRVIDAGLVNKTEEQISFGIGSYVWFDTNNDGKFDPSEKGAPNIAVDLFFPNGLAVSDVFGKPIGRRYTDADGQYRIDNVPRGRYVITFDQIPVDFMISNKLSVNPATGVIPPFNIDTNANQVRPTVAGDRVTAQFFDPTENAPLIPTVLSAVGNKVWFDTNLNGLQDVDEPPAAGISMTLFDSGDNLVGQALTTAHGMYVFDSVLPGIYTIRVYSPLFTIDATLPRVGDGTNDNKAVVNEIANITVNPFGRTFKPVDTATDGQLVAKFIDRDQDVGLRLPYLMAVGDKTWKDTNRNGKQDVGEPPAAGIKVTLMNGLDPDLNAPNMKDPYGKEMIATTDANGNYWIDSIIPGIYYVKFADIPQDYGFTILSNDNVANLQGISNFFNLTQSNPRVQLVDPSVDLGIKNANFILRTIDAGIVTPALEPEIAAISGFTYYDTNSNGVKDVGEGPVANVEVTLTTSSGDPVTGTNGLPIPSVYTDADGYYILPELSPGSYTLLFNGVPVGYKFLVQSTQPYNARIDNILLDKANDQYADINALVDKNYLTSTHIVRDQNKGIVPVPSFAVGDQVIVNPRGTTLQYNAQGLTITLTQNGSPVVNIEGKVVPPTVTDANGMYSFDKLPQGDNYQVSFAGLPDAWIYDFYRSSTLADMSRRENFLPTFSLINSNPNVKPTDKNRHPSITAPLMDDTQDTIVSPVIMSIGDITFNDLPPSNGIQLPFTPESGVTVTLLDGNRAPALDSTGTLVPAQVTGADGRYLFVKLFPGNYIVHFSSMPGFTFTTKNSGDDVTIDSDANSNGFTDVIPLNLARRNITLSAIDFRDFSLAGDLTIDAGYRSLGAPTEFIAGVSFIDYNADGILNNLDIPYPGITVSLYDGDTLVQNTTTDSKGAYLFNNLLKQPYQVVFSNLPDKYYPTVTTVATEGSLVQFPTATKVDVNAGILIPFEYCQDNPRVAVTCFVRNPAPKPLEQAANPVFVDFSYDSFTNRSGEYSDITKLLSFSDVQAIYGVGFDRQDGSWYVAPYLKTSTTYRKSGSIYKVVRAGEFTEYVDVNALLGAGDYNTAGTQQNPTFVGKSVYGDLDIAGDFIYVTVLNTNTVLKIPLREVPTANNIQQMVPPNPCTYPSDWHISGLGYDGVNMFVGGTCSGELTQDPSQLVGTVYKINADGTFTVSLTIPLNYPRGVIQCSLPVCRNRPNAAWQVWPALSVTNGYTPQPILSDIRFIGYQGNMVLGFKDRDGETGENIPAGDQLYACKDASGAYVLESGGNCGSLIGAHRGTSGYIGNAEGPGEGEFFDDNFKNNRWAHDETAWGNMVYLPGSTEVLGTAYDLYSVNEGVVHHYSAINGSRMSTLRLVKDIVDMNEFGKMNSLGDMEINCVDPPTMVGGRVWNDADRNGLQSSKEAGVAGIPVILLAADGTQLTTSTNAQGIYSFKAKPNTPYKILVGPLAPNNVFTTPNAANTQGHTTPMNSIVNAAGTYEFNTAGPGVNRVDINAGTYAS
eukprot:gene10242-11941_t